MGDAHIYIFDYNFFLILRGKHYGSIIMVLYNNYVSFIYKIDVHIVE